MPLSMYQASVPVLTRAMVNLSALLDKAAAHAETANYSTSVLAEARLFPDMRPLTAQIQLASDSAKGAAARLAGLTPPSFPDTETTFADLKERIAKTLAFIETVTPEQIDGSEEREIVLKTGRGEIAFRGQAYLLDFVLPNVFFHVATAYAILRHNGVPLGKRDYLG